MANEIQVSYASGQTLYAVIRDRSGLVWHVAGQAFESWGTEGHGMADYAVTLTDKSGSRYVGDFDSNVPAGTYSVQTFVQAGASPTDTDALVESTELIWSGIARLTAAKLMINKVVQDVATKSVDYYDDDGVTVMLSHDSTNNGITHTRSISS